MLQIKQICKQYKTGGLVQKALDGVSLNLRENEFVAILGPSGSGKTTLLNVIGGLDRYDSGDLIINGISTKKYKDRDWDSYRNHTVGFVFQSYNLIPHQTILSNVELALTISGISKSERKKRAKEALEQVGLGDQLHKKPSQMSGGQMQRVAIARALVNDPDILLADEPTGALDSETSVQVMELLKQVARDRLVVMVTHNPELAEAYATRIVNLRDGKIQSDSDPFLVDEGGMETPVHRNMGKASMSFMTALSLSFHNLQTKKARTLLTSFAGSIGIIGIALILSLSNGVNAYIESVEEETMSEYPLQIQSSGFDMSSMIVSQESSGSDEASGEVKVARMVTDMFSTVSANDLASLKDYLDGGESGIGQYTKAVEYSYGISPQIYRLEKDKARQVNPDQSFSVLGLGSASSTNSMMSAMTSTDVFYEMPENEKLFEDQYDVKAGRWPESYDECVVVLTQNGSVSDFLLYTLGLRDSAELDEMIRQFAAEENVETPDDIRRYDYEEFLGITFKLVNGTDYYEYDDAYHVWKDKSEDDDYVRSLAENGEDLTVVGVVQPSEDASAAMLSAGIGYPSSLTKHVIEKAEDSEIVRQQIADPERNVLTGNSFGEDNEQNSFEMESLFTVDEEMLKSAFGFDQSALNMDLSGYFQLDAGSLDLSGLSGLGDISADMPQLPGLSVEDLIGQTEITVSAEQFAALMQEVMAGYQEYSKSHELTDPSQMGEHFTAYLQTPEAQQILSQGVSQMIDVEVLESQLTASMNSYVQTAVDTYTQAMMQAVQTQVSSMFQQAMTQMASQIETGMQQAMAQLGSGLESAFSVDAEAFANAISVNMDEEELAELLASMMSGQDASYDNNLKKFGYADLDEPSQIDIYPLDFESKEAVLNILDGYNEQMTDEGEEDKVISYTDIVGTLMSSVTSIVDTISYVLVAFVAISLVVSSIMIGVITYISVLERRKEIGILRAIGASKRNISQVFNAETFIIGLCAGVIGIGITLLLLIPGNALIHSVAGSEEVNAVLPAGPGAVLIVLSVILTLVGGLIPSRKAAKSDPVAALRAE